MAVEHIYTCPTFLEDAGFDLTTLNANQRWALIKSVSTRIDALTGQWFNADYGTWRLEGKGSSLIQHSSAIPINEVTSLEVDAANTNNRWAPPSPFVVDDLYFDSSRHSSPAFSGTGIMSAIEFTVHQRAIERIRGYFPAGAQNVIVQGSLGWVEDYNRIEYTTTSDLTGASTASTLSTVDGLSARDVIDLNHVSGASVRAIVTTVDPTNDVITFDPVGTRTLPGTWAAADITVRRLAKVPRPIESVTNFMFALALAEFRSNLAGEVPIDPARIKRERTDDYEYELFAASSAAGSLTGSAIHDKTLQTFCRPGRVVVI